MTRADCGYTSGTGLQEGLVLDAQHYDLLILKGKAHLGATTYAESEAAYKQAVSADGKRVTAWQGLAELFNEQADKAAVDKIIDKIALPKLIETLKVRRCHRTAEGHTLFHAAIIPSWA